MAWPIFPAQLPQPSALRAYARRLAGAVRSVMPPVARSAAGTLGAFLAADGRKQFPNVELSLQVLREHGFSPKLSVDVGAYHGEWTRLIKGVFPSTQVLMVEPQDTKRELLQQVASELDGVTYENALLGARAGEKTTFHQMETGSSVYAETSHFPRVTVEKTTTTLDQLLEGRPAPDLIKLDVQGYELEVLKGATRALGQCEAILMEVSLIPVNSGAPLFADVIAFLQNHGFVVFDFCSQIRRRDGVLWQTDLIFLRANSRFAPRPELNRDNWG